MNNRPTMDQPYEHHSSTRKTFRKATRIKQNFRSENMYRDILVSAAIHIGSSYSCHGYCLKYHENDRMYTSMWENEVNLLEPKTTTALLFDEKKKFHSYGGDAVRKYAELIEQKKDKEWYFFPNFKLKLDDKEDVTESIMVEDINRRKLPAIRLMTEAIRYVKDHLLESRLGDILREYHRDPGLAVYWTVAVPTSWNETSKRFMIHASVLAGIPANQLTVVKESDAAIQFCRYHENETFQDEFLSTVKGKTFMLLDAGGNTVNITTHAVDVDGSITEIGNRRIDALGGRRVDGNVFQMLIKIFGNSVLQRLREEDSREYFRLQRSIEMRNRSYNPYDGRNVILHLSPILSDICMEELNESIKEALESSTFKEHISFKIDKLKIDRNTYEELFKETIDIIIQAVKDEIQSHSDRSLKAIVMVGGFSECVLLQENIQKSFPDTKILVPPQAMLAALIGSIRVGKIVTSVESQKLNFTIGVATLNDFDTNEHPQGKLVQIGDQIFCKNVFSYHIRKGAIVEEDAVHSTKVYSSLNARQVSFLVSASTNDVPSYVDGEDCRPLGSLSIDIPTTGEYKENVLLKMYQNNGSRYLTVETLETYSGISQQIAIPLRDMLSPIALYEDWYLSL